MYMCRTSSSANGGAPHFTDETLRVRRGAGAYEVPMPSSTTTGATTSSFSLAIFTRSKFASAGERPHHQQQFRQHGGGAGTLDDVRWSGDALEATRLTRRGCRICKAYALGTSEVVGIGSARSSSPTRGVTGAAAAHSRRDESEPAVNRYQGHAPHPLISRLSEAKLCQQHQCGEYGLNAMHDLNEWDVGEFGFGDERAWGLKSSTGMEASAGEGLAGEACSSDWERIEWLRGDGVVGA
ncbi:hypothetical protein MSAN_02280100 [Mycena sanguinolenta]|uniref:Uncharacterized protein n=1 Tax=Mycena sanguinolenta TaxID=230812 RepID=A0A8H6XB23_9AGAR|nr:hypothetical protein MSAN_02280100 [Mycena sanguinolenta]